MKRHLTRFLIFPLTTWLGIGLAMIGNPSSTGLRSSYAGPPPVSGNFDLSLPIDQQEFDEGTFGSCPGRPAIIVVSIPNDAEIYIDREKVDLLEIPAKLNYKINGRFPSKEICIRAADFVQYRTLVSIINQIREVSSNRIALLGNKRAEVKRAKLK